ncbi:MAG: hypothetical protein WA940_18035 [Sphingopyxis sp.]
MQGAGSRLAGLTASAILPAFGLAIASTILIVGLSFVMPFLMVVLPLPAHGLFVVLLTRHLLHEPLHLGWRESSVALGLAAIMFAAIWLDQLGTNARCGDGRMYEPSTLPQLPWAWIGWGLLVVTALPSRLLGYPARRLLSWPERVILAAPFAAAVLFTGLPFQRAIDDCAIIEGWGLFEGGLFLIPLLALFLFTLSFSIAVLSAAFVRPEAPEIFT